MIDCGASVEMVYLDDLKVTIRVPLTSMANRQERQEFVRNFIAKELEEIGQKMHGSGRLVKIDDVRFRWEK